MSHYKAKTPRELLADESSPYPCQVCKKEFRSRKELATHAHSK